MTEGMSEVVVLVVVRRTRKTSFTHLVSDSEFTEEKIAVRQRGKKGRSRARIIFGEVVKQEMGSKE